MQHTEDNTEQCREHNTDTSTENSTEQTQYPDTERTENSTYDLHKYSFDLYHEQIYIKNSNTIELYTILQDNI